MQKLDPLHAPPSCTTAHTTARLPAHRTSPHPHPHCAAGCRSTVSQLRCTSVRDSTSVPRPSTSRRVCTATSRPLLPSPRCLRMACTHTHTHNHPHAFIPALHLLNSSLNFSLLSTGQELQRGRASHGTYLILQASATVRKSEGSGGQVGDIFHMQYVCKEPCMPNCATVAAAMDASTCVWKGTRCKWFCTSTNID